MKNFHYDYADVRYGFQFGAGRITRIMHVEGRYHVLGIDTPYHHLQVGLSPTGRSVRVWIDGKEMQVPKDDFDEEPITDSHGNLIGWKK